jgi:hypothetical protein
MEPVRTMTAAHGSLRAARRSPWLASLLAAALGCAHVSGGYQRCDDVPATQLARLPQRLSETGLYERNTLGTLGAGVRAYRPRFELWSDGAEKQRWVDLPGAIDTRDMDAWQFPAGTRFWKEFARDGRRIETRLLAKLGPAPSDWVGASYVWLPDDSDAVLTPEGRSDANGTSHDVPSAAQCFACHGGTSSRILGFSAIQLSDGDGDRELSPGTLAQQGMLSEPPRAEPRIPGEALDVAALGYLHANCAHCHNAARPARSGARCYDPERPFDLALRTSELESLANTAAYRSTRDGIVVPGDAEHSELFRRMESGSIFLRRMPPLATETRDEHGLSLVQRWLASLPLR